MRRRGERLTIGDRVVVGEDDAPVVVLEVLDREVARVFRDGRLELEEVNRYRVLRPCGRRAVVSDRGRPLRRLPDPVAPAPPSAHDVVFRCAGTRALS